LAAVSFGEWLKRRRKAQDLTQEQLAQQIHCSTSALRKIEAEQRRPSEQIVEHLAEVFHIPADERATFLKFARGNWEAAPAGLMDDAPWHISNPKTHLATFLFTDIEDSTKLWESAPEQMKVALQRHHGILQEAITANGGIVFQIIGDAFCAAFPTGPSAISAAVTAQCDLYQEQWDLPFPIRVRMGIHTGEAEPISNDSSIGGYASNPTMNRVARILKAGHGGQVLLSSATKELLKDSLPENMSLRDMGEHHLKNLARPEHLFQLNIPGLPSDFPPLDTLNSYRHNLPLQLTSFIGREKEIAEVRKELEEYRLVTLTGAGGTGKTRLSVQVAAELLDQFPNGVWFIELAPITNPDLIPQTIHITMGLVEQQGKSLVQMLMDFLRDKKALIILDNCEHLIEACAKLTAELLSYSSALKILASSREALGVKGELAWRVPSLSQPDPKKITEPDQLAQYEAVRLFLDRASLANPHFALTKDNAPVIAQICHRLDGIPLALELAAARVKVLGVNQISARLDDRFHLLTGGSRTALPRHQTLRALIDWSYNLLTEKEKALFQRLAVFVGGWMLEAAETICAGGILEPYDILDLLTNLQEKSLVIPDEVDGAVRYRRLETIRQYAREKFLETDEVETVRNKHLAWVLEWAEGIEPELRGRNQVMRLKQVKAELDNIRGAIEWGLGRGQIENSMRIVLALEKFWDGKHPYLESRHWLEKGLSFRESLTKRTLAKILSAAAWLAYRQNDLEAMGLYIEESLTLARALNDKPLIARALRITSAVHMAHGQFLEWKRWNEEAHSIYQELEDKAGLVLLAQDEALAQTFFQRDVSRAIEILGNHLSLVEALDDISTSAWFQYALGSFNLMRDEFEKARVLMKNALLIFRQINYVYFVGNCLVAFASLANGLKNPVRAARLFGARDSINESIGAVDNQQIQRIFGPILERTKSMLDEATFQSAWAEGKAMTMDQAIEYALSEESA
jgi:predicted ATPase/class 3 adenylate cyclase